VLNRPTTYIALRTPDGGYWDAQVGRVTADIDRASWFTDTAAAKAAASAAPMLTTLVHVNSDLGVEVEAES
jgi:predicted NUDIX family NTP pyrophosphohydrolase